MFEFLTLILSIKMVMDSTQSILVSSSSNSKLLRIMLYIWLRLYPHTYYELLANYSLYYKEMLMSLQKTASPVSGQQLLLLDLAELRILCLVSLFFPLRDYILLYVHYVHAEI